PVQKGYQKCNSRSDTRKIKTDQTAGIGLSGMTLVLIMGLIDIVVLISFVEVTSLPTLTD
ncbi:hypothetical protein CHS0354_034616, partial [Potamilus streckersoni]